MKTKEQWSAEAFELSSISRENFEKTVTKIQRDAASAVLEKGIEEVYSGFDKDKLRTLRANLPKIFPILIALLALVFQGCESALATQSFGFDPLSTNPVDSFAFAWTNTVTGTPVPVKAKLDITPSTVKPTIRIVSSVIPAVTNFGLAWTASPSPNLSGYNLYTTPNDENYTLAAQLGNVTSGILPMSAPADIVVAAVDMSGDISDFSNPVQFPPLGPVTNVITFFTQVYTNPIDTKFYRVQSTTDLKSGIWSNETMSVSNIILQ